jgi:hypothetical protein
MSEATINWGMDPTIFTLPVSNKAAFGISLDGSEFKDGESRSAHIIRDIYNRNPVLINTLDELINGWGFTGEAADNFEDGFALAYRLFSYESEIADTSLPVVTPANTRTFLVKLQSEQQTGAEYCRSRYNDLMETNKTYLQSLAEAMPGGDKLDDMQKIIFMIGGLNLHDIFLQQKFAPEYAKSIVEIYLSSAHETAWSREQI